MANTSTDAIYCVKCGRTKRPQEFYTTNNLEKYPTGKVDQCKDCMTLHLDNFDPSTFLWIIEELDILKFKKPNLRIEINKATNFF